MTPGKARLAELLADVRAKAADVDAARKAASEASDAIRDASRRYDLERKRLAHAQRAYCQSEEAYELAARGDAAANIAGDVTGGRS